MHDALELAYWERQIVPHARCSNIKKEFYNLQVKDKLCALVDDLLIVLFIVVGSKQSK